jgi:hypothetical protein
MRESSKAYRSAGLGLLSAVACGMCSAVLAQSVPLDFIGSPEVYKVVAANEQFVLVQGTWKPGQRDQFHSHTAQTYYWLSDCTLRFYLPNGSFQDATRKAGQAGSSPPVQNHSVENRGTSDCSVLMFEAKPAP